MNNPNEIVKNNWLALVDEVAEASLQAGRSPADVCIVGVTKYVDATVTRYLVEAGCKHLGESRPQALWDKAAALSDLSPCWHLIGHLQRNKARRTLPLISLLHSLDSTRLAEELSKQAIALELVLDVLLEVNIGNEPNKGGFDFFSVQAACDTIAGFPGIRLKGLMGMATLASHHAEGMQQARREFARLRELRDTLVDRGLPPECSLNELSMGMSGDFPAAIAEGATIIRVGSRLFDGI